MFIGRLLVEDYAVLEGDLLTGVPGSLFLPLAEAVVFALAGGRLLGAQLSIRDWIGIGLIAGRVISVVLA